MSYESGAMSNRATESQIRRLIELKLEFHRDITWLEAKALIREYHKNKKRKASGNPQ
jgi:hypothetical protein